MAGSGLFLAPNWIGLFCQAWARLRYLEFRPLTLRGGFCSWLIRLVLFLVHVKVISLDVVHVFALSFVEIIIHLQLLWVSLLPTPLGSSRPSICLNLYKFELSNSLRFCPNRCDWDRRCHSPHEARQPVWNEFDNLQKTHSDLRRNILTKASIIHLTKFDRTKAFYILSFRISSFTPFWQSSSCLLTPAAFLYNQPKPYQISKLRLNVNQSSSISDNGPNAFWEPHIFHELAQLREERVLELLEPYPHICSPILWKYIKWSERK